MIQRFVHALGRTWQGLLATAVLLTLLSAAGWAWLQGHGGALATKPDTRLQCALPATPAQNAGHPGMVWVPPGRYTMGDTRYPEEQPLRPVQVAGFWMDRTEVTNDQFAEFVQATGYVTVAERPVDPKTHPGLPADMLKPGAVVFVAPQTVNGRDDVSQWWHYLPGASWRHPGGPQTGIEGHGAFPVVAVTLEDAQAYARWKGRSLPSEAQWEWAARGASPQPLPDHEQPKDANTWQGIFPTVNSGEDGFTGLAPVGCYAPNALGLFDMIGNVWELTTDAWRPSHADGAAPDQMPAALRGQPAGQHVIKGGSFLCSPDYCMRYRAGARQPQDDDLAASHLGFRTILLAPPPAQQP
jgi:formylglycine-generating enzyme required for sulfatase activity